MSREKEPIFGIMNLYSAILGQPVRLRAVYSRTAPRLAAFLRAAARRIGLAGLDRDSCAGPPSPEEVIGYRVRRLRIRTNVFAGERAAFDCLAAACGGLFTWCVLFGIGRNTLTAACGIILTLFCFALFRLVLFRREWMRQGEAVERFDAELGFQQRLITLLDYACRQRKPLLYKTLADDIVSRLGEERVREMRPHRTPLSAYAAAVLALAVLLNVALTLSAPEPGHALAAAVEEPAAGSGGGPEGEHAHSGAETCLAGDESGRLNAVGRTGDRLAQLFSLKESAAGPVSGGKLASLTPEGGWPGPAAPLMRLLRPFSRGAEPGKEGSGGPKGTGWMDTAAGRSAAPPAAPPVKAARGTGSMRDSLSQASRMAEGSKEQSFPEGAGSKAQCRKEVASVSLPAEEGAVKPSSCKKAGGKKQSGKRASCDEKEKGGTLKQESSCKKGAPAAKTGQPDGDADEGFPTDQSGNAGEGFPTGQAGAKDATGGRFAVNSCVKGGVPSEGGGSPGPKRDYESVTDVGEKSSGAGTRPGRKRGSGTPETPPAEAGENLHIALRGQSREAARGTRRLTLSPGDAAADSGEVLRPSVGIAADARLSAEQAEEDAIETAAIPLEYKAIIKHIQLKEEQEEEGSNDAEADRGD